MSWVEPSEGYRLVGMINIIVWVGNNFKLKLWSMMHIKSRQYFQTTPARFIEYSSETCSQPQIRIAEQLRDTNLIIIACTLSHANFALDVGRAFTKTLLIATLYHSRRKWKANCAFCFVCTKFKVRYLIQLCREVLRNGLQMCRLWKALRNAGLWDFNWF